MEKTYRGFAIWEEDGDIYAEDTDLIRLENGDLFLGPFESVEEIEEEIDLELDGAYY